jgi:tetratricopeptide (TPR) repeat protein/serine/threonine protein kinase
MNERAIFEEALQRATPDERSKYLDEACAGDDALRRRVEALLQSHEQAGSFMGIPVPERLVGKFAVTQDSAPSGAPTATLDQPNSEAAGTVIAGRYKLLEEIGEGGMGTVWMAQQSEPIKRLVAIKLIKPGMDSKQVLARFDAERQALALMDHPNIARVFDAGSTGEVGSRQSAVGSEEKQSGLPTAYCLLPTADGRPYFVMELVTGVPITKYCDEHHLTPRQRLELFIPVCQAIQHAHQKGIIHRDIKPSNVLVAMYDDRPVPKVIDFGVAKATGQQLTEATLHTGFGAVVGTIEYMSPEQASFNQLDVDTRSDIYSLGVLLYELLAGSPPFTRKEMETAGLLETLRVIREQEPSKPSTKLGSSDALPTLSANRATEPKRLTRLIRGELDWIVMKALEKDRERRYETANGFAMDVQRYLADEPVQACPPSAGYRLRKFVRRNKGRLAVAASVLLAVTVMAASIGWAVRDRVARAAELEQAETARLANVAGQVRDSLNTARTLITEDKLASARAKLAQARAHLGNDGSALGELAAQVVAGEAELDRFQLFLDLIDRAHQAETAPLLEPALAADDSHGRAGTPAPVKTGGRRPAAAVPFLLEALQRYGVLERDDWSSALEGGLLGRQQVELVRRLAYEELLWLAADVRGRQHEHQSGRKLSREAAARQALVYLGKAENAHRPTPVLYALRARCHKALGEEGAAQAATQLADKTPATMALDHYLQGQLAHDAKQLHEGVQAFEAALGLEPTHYWSLMWLGHCLCDLGQDPEHYAEAARVYTGCILKRPDHSHAYYCRAAANHKLRRYEQAVSDLSKAIELDPQHAPAWNNRGAIHHKLGQPDKAIADFSKAIELDPQHAPAWNNRGAIHYKLGQLNMAVANFSKAIELDANYAPTWNNRGLVYKKQGQLDMAASDFSKAIELDPTYARAWDNRGLAYIVLGQPDKAVIDCSKAIDLDPKLRDAWYNRAWAYNQLRQPEKAIADCSKAIELDPQYAPAWNTRGISHNRMGRPDKGLADFTKAIDLDEKFADAWYNRGVTYRRLDQPEKAIADYSKAIELDPRNVQALFNRGAIYRQLGHAEKAIADFSKFIELAPNDPQLIQAYLLRADAHSRLTHFEQARTDYQAFLKRAPDHAGAHNALAWLLATCPDAKVRDPGQAVELAKKAVQLAPKAGNHWQTLGVAHYRTGDWTAAVAALAKSRELRKGWGATDRLFLAMSHQKLGNHDEARKVYEQALQWLEKDKEGLEKDKWHAEELRRFRAEAAEVLELKKN